MSSLLSSLIYNNSQNSEPSSKAAEEKYEFDPYDNFYGRDYTEDEPSIHNGTEGKTNDNGEKKEYDFQKNSHDRDFYLSEATRAKQDMRRKKRRSRYENETLEEREERLNQDRIRFSRRKRFRYMRYNFRDETDYGGSVAKMVKFEMDASDKFNNLSPKRKNLIDSEEDEVDDGERKKIKIEDSENMIGTKIGDGRNSSGSDSDESNESEIHGEKTQGGHALGSLLDRMKKFEHEAKDILEKKRIVHEKDAVRFRDQKDNMRKDPMLFLNHGYNAPTIEDDPNRNLFYMKMANQQDPKRRSNIGGVRANESYCKEKEHSKAISKEEPRGLNKSKINAYQNGASLHLPLNCFNPCVSRLHYPRNQDTYHYLPFSREDITSLRLKTAQNDSDKTVFNPFDVERQFYRKSKHSFVPLEFHSKNMHLFAARLIVSCAEIINTDDTNKSKNINNLSRIIDMLYRKKKSAQRKLMIIRQSEELASNYVMWQEIEPRAKRLLSMNLLDASEYYFLKKELLSDQGEMFCDINLTSAGVEFGENAKMKRKNMLLFIENIEESHNVKKDIKNRDDSSIENKKSDPTKSFYCMENSTLIKATESSDLLSLSREEKYSQVMHFTDPDLDTIRLTLAAMYSELSLQRSRRLKDPNPKHRRATYHKKETIHDTIISYFEKATDEVWFIGVMDKGKTLHLKNLNAPLMQTILMRQSYIANNRSLALPLRTEEEDSKKSEKEHLATDYHSVAEELCSVGLPLCKDFRVAFSPAIHITT